MMAREVLQKHTAVPHDERALFLAYVLGITRVNLLAHDEQIVPFFAYWRYRAYLSTRERGFSFQATVGEAWFCERLFFVSTHTLVPRPETETLVTHAATLCHALLPGVVIDVGTGTGCIPVTIEKILEKNISSCIQFLAIEPSWRARLIAKKNIKKYSATTALLPGTFLFSAHKTIESCIEKKLPILITANLPYLTKAEIDEEPTIRREPHQALYGGVDGLALYRTLFQHLAPCVGRGSTITLLTEQSPWQTPILEKEMQNMFGSAVEIGTIPDLTGAARFLQFTFSSSVSTVPGGTM